MSVHDHDSPDLLSTNINDHVTLHPPASTILPSKSGMNFILPGESSNSIASTVDSHIFSIKTDVLECPITKDLMRDAVVDPEGNSYDKEAIIKWIRKHHTSPITRTPLQVNQLIPNRAARQLIESIQRPLPEQNSKQIVAVTIEQLSSSPSRVPAPAPAPSQQQMQQHVVVIVHMDDNNNNNNVQSERPTTLAAETISPEFNQFFDNLSSLLTMKSILLGLYSVFAYICIFICCYVLIKPTNWSTKDNVIFISFAGILGSAIIFMLAAFVSTTSCCVFQQHEMQANNPENNERGQIQTGMSSNIISHGQDAS